MTPPKTGSEIATELEGQIDDFEQSISTGLPPDATGIVLDTLLGAGADFGRGLADVLRLGEASGTAFGEGAGAGETALAVGGDALRAAAIAAPLAGAGRVAAGRAAGPAVARAGAKLSKEAQKSIRSFDKRIAEHQKKLADFKANPTPRPGTEGLSKEIQQQSIEGRIRHLEKEIETFRNNIEKLRGGRQ